jgi:hypothetical protein
MIEVVTRWQSSEPVGEDEAAGAGGDVDDADDGLVGHALVVGRVIENPTAPIAVNASEQSAEIDQDPRDGEQAGSAGH